MIKYGINREALIDHHRLQLADLYDAVGQQAFESRLAAFTASDPSIASILTLADGELMYDSESFVPMAVDHGKQNLVLVLGNPAPESVALGAMFAYENHGKRHHRFWRVLDTAGILRFGEDPDTLDPYAKMARLFAGQYNSPFNLAIVPFYSLPTPPGGEWGGVAGIRKLFGAAFSKIEAYDMSRLNQLFDEWLHDGDSVLVFQKDAYEALNVAQEDRKPYNYRALLQQPATTRFATGNGAIANLYCMLPTRLLHSGQTKSALAQLALNGLSNG